MSARQTTERLKRVKRNGCLIGIGASAGGIQPMLEIIADLPEDFEATILIAVHRPIDVPNYLKQMIERRATIDVFTPADDDKLHCAAIYVPRANQILEASEHQIAITNDPLGLRKLKRIDDLFASIADSAGSSAVGVLLSGCLDDGVEGLQRIADQGGTTVVQAPRDAEFPALPLNALRAFSPTFIADAGDIAPILQKLARQEPCYWVYQTEN